MSAVYGWCMACGRIKDFGLLPFPHQRKICTQGLSMLGRTRSLRQGQKELTEKPVFEINILFVDLAFHMASGSFKALCCSCRARDSGNTAVESLAKSPSRTATLTVLLAIL